jgi:hypothetical protein
MGTILKSDILVGASASDQVGMTSLTIAYSIKCSGIADAMSTAPAIGTVNGGLVCTSKALRTLPGVTDSVCEVGCTFTMNSGTLNTSGSLKSQQFSYDKNGTAVTIQYTDGGKKDKYIAIFGKRTPLGVYTATRYEQQDAQSAFGGELGTTNSAAFLGNDMGTMMLVGCDGEMVAPGWWNNRYVWEFDPDGYNPLVSYFNRWGKIPPNIVGPGAPPFTPGQDNGWVVPDVYKTNDFSGDFGWCESLQT